MQLAAAAALRRPPPCSGGTAARQLWMQLELPGAARTRTASDRPLQQHARVTPSNSTARVQHIRQGTRAQAASRAAGSRHGRLYSRRWHLSNHTRHAGHTHHSGILTKTQSHVGSCSQSEFPCTWICTLQVADSGRAPSSGVAHIAGCSVTGAVQVIERASNAS